MPNLHYIPEVSRLIANNSANKQANSVRDVFLDDVEAALYLLTIEDDQKSIYFNYEQLLKNGVPKEIARLNTPVSRYSKMRAKANLRNWLGFLMLRKAKDAQWEIKQFADAVGSIIEQLWPRTYALFLEYDFNGMRLSASETKMLQEFINYGVPFSKDWETLKKKING